MKKIIAGAMLLAALVFSSWNVAAGWASIAAVFPLSDRHMPTSATVQEREPSKLPEPSEGAPVEDNVVRVPREEVDTVLVLSYHAFTENMSVIEKNDLYISPQTFENQIITLLECGYTPIFASELTADMLPEKPVVITMDDGYMDNYELAFPILKKYNVKATIFIISSYMDEEETGEFFSWSIAREMYESGVVELQSHTYDMHNGNGLAYEAGTNYDEWLTQLERDAELAEEIFLEKLGYAPTVLCCPFGKWNKDVSEFYSDRYGVVFYGEYDLADLSRDSLMALPRIWAVEATVIKP